MKRTLGKKQYALLYTGIFAVFCLGVFALFLKKGRGFVWNEDGSPQYLPYLAYTGQYVRDWLRRALQGDFSLRMFDFTIGPGSDVGTIVRAHPLDFLSVFVPAAHTETLYTVLYLLRLYLAGWSFSLFMFLWKSPSFPVLTGALIYVFSGYGIFLGSRHTFFLTAMITFPLLLAGAEKVMRRERGVLFVLSVFCAFAGNYYFMYMSTIGTCLYILLRFPDLYREKRIRQFLILFLKMTALYLLGTAMAMTTLLPIAANLLTSSRLSHGSGPDRLFLYAHGRDYLRLLCGIFTPEISPVNGAFLTVAAPVIPALGIVLTGGRGKHTLLKRCGAVLLLCLLLPAFSYLMSGFADDNARWTYLCTFFLAVSLPAAAECMEQPDRRGKIGIAAAAGLFLLLALLNVSDIRVIYLLWAGAGVFAVSAYVLLSGRSRTLRRYLPCVMLLAVFLSCAGNSFFYYSGRFEDHLKEFAGRGKGFSLITDSEFVNLAGIEDDSFWRADSNLVTSGRENCSVLLGYRGLSMYNSTLSGPYTQSLAEQENTGLASLHRFQGLDGHSAAEALANVRYYLTTKDGQQHVPAGFVKAERYCTQHNDIYENTQPLPFGYTYTKVISREDYGKLSAADKEQCMLEAAVLEEVPAGFETVSGPSQPALSTVLVLPETGDGAVRTQTGYHADSRGAVISIPYEQRAGYDTYLRLAGFSHAGRYTTVQITAPDLTSTLTLRGPDEKFSVQAEAYMIRLGIGQQDGPAAVSLTLSKRGAYELSEAQIIYVPMGRFPDHLSALAQDALTDPVFEGNTISGSVNAREDLIMVFSVPYSRGWHAMIDGREAPLMQTNTAYTGVVIEAGEHAVKLWYETPGAAAGRLIALAGWLMFSLYVLAGRRKRKGSLPHAG